MIVAKARPYGTLRDYIFKKVGVEAGEKNFKNNFPNVGKELLVTCGIATKITVTLMVK